jgi:hypothetical protein
MSNPLANPDLWDTSGGAAQWNPDSRTWSTPIGSAPGNADLIYIGSFPSESFEFYAVQTGNITEPLTVTVDGVTTTYTLAENISQKITVPAASTSLELNVTADFYPDATYTPIPRFSDCSFYNAFAAGSCTVQVSGIGTQLFSQVMAPGDTAAFNDDSFEVSVDADGHVTLAAKHKGIGFVPNINGLLLRVVPGYSLGEAPLCFVDMTVTPEWSDGAWADSGDTETPLTSFDPVTPETVTRTSEQERDYWELRLEASP